MATRERELRHTVTESAPSAKAAASARDAANAPSARPWRRARSSRGFSDEAAWPESTSGEPTPGNAPGAGYSRRPVSEAPTVVVPSHQGAHLLARLLPSLASQSRPVDVVVVDNASTDGTAALLADRFPHVRRVALRENAGFARAVNRGVAATDARTVIVLDNDVVCEPEFVERLAGTLDPAGGVVMAAGVLLAPAAPATIDTAGVVFDRTLFAIDHLHGRPLADLERAPDPLGPTGGAAAYDRAAFDAVGGFDERFFA